MNNKKKNYGGNNILEDWRFWIGVVLILYLFIDEWYDRYGNKYDIVGPPGLYK